ncbi:MAG: site-2 protease family protein [Deltaproteobacteria bacterium]|nr:site-2 protease family protein [Deltaproteobacteria bacterium]
MFGKGIKLLTIWGIEVWMDFSWIIIFILISWTLAAGYFPGEYPGFTSSTYWMMGIISALLLFACVLLHELSHSYVAIKSGIPVPRITLFIFGGVAQIAQEPEDARTEFNIAIAGPICSLALGILFWLLTKTKFVLDSKALLIVFGYLAFINIALVVFNMIPGFPLDGGRILRAFLWKRWGDVRKATYAVSQIGSWFGILLISFGVVNFLFGNLIGGIWFVFIGMFLNQAAKAGYQMTLLKESLSGIRVKQVMSRDVVTVPEAVSLEDLVKNYFERHFFMSFPVERDGVLAGIISLKQVKAVPKEEWVSRRVGEVMTKDVLSVRPDDEVSEALSVMLRDNAGRLPVVEGEKIVGILSRRDVMNMLKIKSDLGI